MTKLDEARNIINEVDEKIAALFERRMQASKMVAEYKHEKNLPIFDATREKQVIEKNSSYILNEELKPYYIAFQQYVMDVSKEYQKHLLQEMNSCIGDEGSVEQTSDEKHSVGSYDISFIRGGISKVHELWGKGEKTFILTDSGVPAEYAKKVAECCNDALICTIPQGESSKNIKCLTDIWQKMTEFELTRTDRIIAVGGGVVGDIAGFAAATYMRGIKFYNIPTTVLSQVDSSVGGKTAIDFGGYKNIIGSFYQPSGVLIDTDTLLSLPARHIANGLAEAIKMALTHDKDLFERFENIDPDDLSSIEKLLSDAVDIKMQVVMRDEKETSERKSLNFGHTIAHAIESSLSFGELYHGECVAIGMIPMCSENVRMRLIPLLEKLGLPTKFPVSPERIIQACRHDKKRSGEKITIVYVPDIGTYEFRNISFEELYEYIRDTK